MARLVSFAVLIVILILIALLFFRVMASFMLPLFLAALLVVVFHPLYRWTLVRCRNQRYVAAALTTIMASHDLTTRLVDNGFDPEFQTGNEAREFVVREIRKWRQAVKDSGAKSN